MNTPISNFKKPFAATARKKTITDANKTCAAASNASSAPVADLWFSSEDEQAAPPSANTDSLKPCTPAKVAAATKPLLNDFGFSSDDGF